MPLSCSINQFEMRKIILSQHVSLDGFMAGPNGEMNWIKVDSEMFDLVGSFTDEADAAIYGRTTYEMMDSYWPTAADKPNASKHDRHHSTWYNEAEKIVISKTMKDVVKNNTTIINDNIADEVAKIKHQPGKNIMVFGSPSVSRLLIANNLVDDYWLFINPVILGEGLPLFSNPVHRIHLQLAANHAFGCGVIGLHYTAV
jgi:dihydrofolate reductase